MESLPSKRGGRYLGGENFSGADQGPEEYVSHEEASEYAREKDEMEDAILEKIDDDLSNKTDEELEEDLNFMAVEDARKRWNSSTYYPKRFTDLPSESEKAILDEAIKEADEHEEERVSGKKFPTQKEAKTTRASRNKKWIRNLKQSAIWPKRGESKEQINRDKNITRAQHKSPKNHPLS